MTLVATEESCRVAISRSWPPQSGQASTSITNVRCISPGAIEEFVDQVVPGLQRRGRSRTDYAGATARDHLMPEDERESA